MPIRVHPRVFEQHPELTEDDVYAAFETTLRRVPRFDTDPMQWVGVGMDSRGRLLQWVAVEDAPSNWHIFHAMNATTKTLIEVGIRER